MVSAGLEVVYGDVEPDEVVLQGSSAPAFVKLHLKQKSHFFFVPLLFFLACFHYTYNLDIYRKWVRRDGNHMD